jgi:hypothetical protein
MGWAPSPVTGGFYAHTDGRYASMGLAPSPVTGGPYVHTGRIKLKSLPKPKMPKLTLSKKRRTKRKSRH